MQFYDADVRTGDMWAKLSRIRIINISIHSFKLLLDDYLIIIIIIIIIINIIILRKIKIIMIIIIIIVIITITIIMIITV